MDHGGEFLAEPSVRRVRGLVAGRGAPLFPDLPASPGDLSQPAELVLTAIYLVPALTLVMFLVAEVGLWLWLVELPSPDRSQAVSAWLQLIRQGIYFYLAVAAIYFLATLSSLISARFHSPFEIARPRSSL